MKDGSTRRLARPGQAEAPPKDRFLHDFDVRLVALSGPASGTAYPIARARTVLGRGPGVDYGFDDTAMSRQHAVLEVSGNVLTARDLGSTNGMLVNGTRVQSAELHHGDRLQLGTWAFQVLIEERSSSTDVYELSAEV